VEVLLPLRTVQITWFFLIERYPISGISINNLDMEPVM
jgi:hypothetical protein